ncbi:T6SS effector amidase Tae4 family protein [Caballeronia sp. GAWG1-5s-s]|uniref:T6SS effector amidase Tae4 family protein n=1 Tax=Caballeronia sp. GAWG1-5s-s TaxID=2921743 RepID=UPI0020285712|nr:T6SS effector amidase Tae4 family protein [Caballeronia sp. GAWG1-5s-s]
MPNAKTIVQTNRIPGSVRLVNLRVVPFAELWAAYPKSAPCIDPSTGKAAFEDECAIRFGACLAAVGITNKSFKGETCWFHGHPRSHTLRAKEVAQWLHLQPFAGCPTPETVTGEDWKDKITGRTGIAFFGSYWRRSLKERQPSGDHIDLWDGQRLTPSTETTLRFGLGISHVWNPLSAIGIGPENFYSDLSQAKTILFWDIK